MWIMSCIWIVTLKYERIEFHYKAETYRFCSKCKAQSYGILEKHLKHWLNELEQRSQKRKNIDDLF